LWRIEGRGFQLMALRRRSTERQQEFWIPAEDVTRAPRHVFYERLNQLLGDAGFDRFVEDLVAPFYADGGRPSVPPGVYFRMLFVGYFEDIDSQRGIAWRCADSRSLERFLGIGVRDQVPDHSSLTRIRDRLPLDVHEKVFTFMLAIAVEKKLVDGSQAAVDSTYLEANAAMKSIVRRDSGEDWKEYVKRLMIEEGVIDEDDDPPADELRRFDRKRKGKKVSNDDWQSPSDDDARIRKMKDGRVRMAYKAEHTVDLETEFVLSADVRHGTDPDTQTLLTSVESAQQNLTSAGSDATINEVAADRGYHSNDQITDCTEAGIRTYIAEPRSPKNRKWTDKPPSMKRAVLNNRRRSKRRKSRDLQRLRSERVERSFAHICDSGGSRRSWLRGLEKVNKRYGMAAAAHNLSLLMRKLFGTGKPRQFAAAADALQSISLTIPHSITRLINYQFTRRPDCFSTAC